MADSTGIEWTDATWNTTVGCTHVSPGCDHCYAARLASGRLKNRPPYDGLAEAGTFNGTVRVLPDRLELPLRWRKPRKVFVDSMSDLFHDAVPDEHVARVFAVMALSRQHTFQVLTKRHARMRSLLGSDSFRGMVAEQLAMPGGILRVAARHNVEPGDDWRLEEINYRDLLGRWWVPPWPLPKVWLGVSVEDQKRADLRIPALRGTTAAVRFLSCEPLLGPLELDLYGIGWVIVGGESGPDARPMHPDWVRSLRDQCADAGVPFLFKQWGEWSPVSPGGLGKKELVAMLPDGSLYDGHTNESWQASTCLYRIGKKAAGRVLDGRTHDDYPGG